MSVRESLFLKDCFYFSFCCARILHLGVCRRLHVSAEPEVIRPPRTAVTGSWKSPNMGAGN